MSKSFYFVHHESDCAWREVNLTDEEIDKLLDDPLVELIDKEHFLRLEKQGYEVHY